MVKTLAVISPAKTLDFDNEAPVDTVTDYRFGDAAQSLVEVMKGKTAADLKAMMKISDKLADLNVQRFQQWTPNMTAGNSKAALFAFKGDVYTGLSAETLTETQIHQAQKSVRILSGLYGLLRPLDRIQPYRLEMGTRVQTDAGQNLYDFWGDRITDLLNEDIRQEGSEVLINVASEEYFKAVKPSRLSCPVITPVFKDEKNGQYKIISFFAKKARGMMIRYLLEASPKSLEDIKAFNYAGYQYSGIDSTETEWVFKRPESFANSSK